MPHWVWATSRFLRHLAKIQLNFLNCFSHLKKNYVLKFSSIIFVVILKLQKLSAAGGMEVEGNVAGTAGTGTSTSGFYIPK